MDPLESLEACDTLFLVGLCEPAENQLQVLLQEARTHYDHPKRTVVAGVDLGISYPIEPDDHSRFFRLDWQRYVAYQVLDESYSKWPDGETFTGKNLRVFGESAFLHYLRQTSFASPQHPGDFQHYEILTQMHVVDVAAQDPPEISILTRAGVDQGKSPVCRVAFPR